MINAIKQFFLDLQLKIWLAINGAKVRLAEERGDTNFISIAIILIVVITVAIVFIQFKDAILGRFQTATQNLLGALGG